MESIEGSETSAYNNQTPGKHPKQYIIDSKHGESLKSRMLKDASIIVTKTHLQIPIAEEEFLNHISG